MRRRGEPRPGWAAGGFLPGTPGGAGRLGAWLALVILGVFFALPMLWLVTAPFNARPTLAMGITRFTFGNFLAVWRNSTAVGAFRNSLLQSLCAMAAASITATLAAYSLSRGDFPWRDQLLYVLILFSSMVSGVAAMVPLYVLTNRLGLLDTHLGLILVYVGGTLPTSIFIMKDFVDSIPRAYEEAALVDGSTNLQVLVNVAAPLCRPGMAVIAVLVFVNTWSNFLMPFILLRSVGREPISVAIYSFYNEVGIPVLGLVSAYALLYAIPVVILYTVVNRRFGFKFYGGLKT